MRIAFSLVVLLAACATLDREECVHADWYAIGLEDHRRACAKHYVAPNTERYLAAASRA